MCDTIVATQKATADGSIILAKNSDREANEAQLLKHLTRRHFGSPTALKCTYISIPQVPETYEVLLSKPFWMWGCEMGANEYGLAIGNEAVFTREPYEKKGLLGMDLIRLALERCQTAREALMLITELIERYGQGGKASLQKRLYYHNSFILADLQEAYVLETANKHWVAVKVDGIRSISNGLTIGEEYHLSSKNIEDYAIKKGYLKKGKTFNFKKCFSDSFYTYFSRCSVRQNRTTALAVQHTGSISPQTMFSLLRDHGQDDLYLPPDRTNMGTVCMHASLPPTRPSQSVAAFVAHLRKDRPVYWATGSSAPCTSVFLPFYLTGKEIDYFQARETDTYSVKSYWWQHELVHRQAIFKWDYFVNNIIPEIRALEDQFLTEESKLYTAGMEINNSHKFYNFSQKCVEKALDANKSWFEKLRSAPKSSTRISFKLFWKIQNRKARIPL